MKIIAEYNLLCNMQYYMEYCHTNGYVTPHDWLEKYKHYEDKKEPISYTEEEVKNILVKLQNCRIVYENPLTDRRCTTTNWIIENFEEWFNSNKKK